MLITGDINIDDSQLIQMTMLIYTNYNCAYQDCKFSYLICITNWLHFGEQPNE